MPETLIAVTLPEMGESVTEGSIVEWRVKAGQWVEAGAPLVDVTTDKVDVEVPAPASGLVTALAAEEGATVDVGALLAQIDTSAARPDGAAPAPGAARHATAAAPAEAAVPSSYGAAGAPPAPPPSSNSATAAATGSGLASHRAQRLAEREHLDLRTIAGSGPNGLILHADVIAAAAHGATRLSNGNGRSSGAGSAAAAAPLPPLGRDARVTPLKGPANALVSAMEQSLTIPTATSFRTLHVGTLEARRAELNAALKGAGRGEKISFTHLIAFALVRAAREVPAIVASFRRENGTAARVEAGIHLGSPSIRSAKTGRASSSCRSLSKPMRSIFAAFRAAYEDLIAKARDGKLGSDDMAGATFTLTNPGGIGTIASVPRLTAGQGAILAAGAIAYPPGFARANEAALKSLGVEKIMTLTSTYDHRVIQGAQSGEYLKRVDELLGGQDGFYEDAFAAFGLTASSCRCDGSGARHSFPQRAAHPNAHQAAAATATAGSVTELPVTPPREFEAYSDELLRAVAAGMAILSAYRRHGHLAATLDPLGTQPPGDPALDWHNYALTPSVMSAIPASILRTKVKGDTLADVVGELRKTYGSTIAYEVEHIANIEQREWLRDYIESGAHFVQLAPERARNVLERLTKVETFERYLRKTYIGQKTFSIEGLDAMIPMLEEIDHASRRGRRAHGRARHGASRPPGDDRARRESPLRRDLGGVRSGRPARRGRERRRHGRREVPSRRRGLVRSAERSRRQRRPCEQSEPSRSRRRRGRRAHARAADRPRSRLKRRSMSAGRRRSSSTATPRSRRKASWPKCSTCRRSRATRPAARSTSSRTIRSASRRIRSTRAPRATRPISPRASTCRSCT